MIPILYSQEETAFTSNGIGRLVDCVSCEVTEERNGEFEVEFQYPITGKHYGEITEGRIILVDHDEQGDAQPFVIYRHSAPINGVVTFNAHHISYGLSSVIVEPFTATSVADAFNTFVHSNMNTNPYAFWTDNTTGGNMKSEVPASVRSLMGGTEGSILDVFGGEYAFDKFLVRNYAHRGSNKGVTIRYGKNLTNIVWEVDTMDLYSNVVPFWSDGESTVVYGGIVGANLTAYWTDENGTVITDENNVPIELTRINNNVTTLDLSQEFDEAPTVTELEEKAAQYLAANTPWIPKENIKIEFVPLWQTDEYADVAPLERVCLCDTVTVYYTDLGVRATAKVIKVVWDALLEKYTTIELGQAKSSFADTIIGAVDNKLAEAIANVPTTSAVQAAIDHATDLITGGMGGHIVFLYDADGKPTDMLVMDTEDVSTAVHVLRINVNGIGFSSTGVSGTYTSAWTLDGAFVADWITAGHLSANRIQGGTLTLGGTGNGNGLMIVYNASGTEIGRWDNTGLSMQYGNLTQKFGAITYTDWLNRSTNAAGICLEGSSSFYSSHEAARAIGNIYDVINFTTIPTNSVVNTESFTGGMNLDLRTIILAASGSYARQCFKETFNRDHVEWQFWKTQTSGTGMEQTGKFAFGNSGLYFNYESSGLNQLRPGMKLTSSEIILQGGYANSYPRIYIASGTIGFRATGGSATLVVNTSGGTLNGRTITTTSSSKRYKHDITNKINNELDAHRLYKLEMKQFVYNEDHMPPYACMAGKTIPGFIAEDVAEIYPAATIYNEDGEVESWSEAQIIPGMLKLIQEQHDEIESLKERLAKLEQVVEMFANDMR